MRLHPAPFPFYSILSFLCFLAPEELFLGIGRGIVRRIKVVVVVVVMMGMGGRRRRKEEEEGVGRKARALEVKVPSFFRCPISLDVMKSPVSLCTGVTYDRSSIQRWIQSGNATCPATMQPLSSTDLVPNLTLLRLIHLWNPNTPNIPSPSSAAADLLREARDAADPVPALREIAEILDDDDDDDDDEFEKNGLAAGCAAVVAPLLRVQGAEEAAARVLALVLASGCVEDADKRAVAAAVAAEPGASAAALSRLLKKKKATPDPRIEAARVLESLIAACGTESEVAAVAEAPDLIPELIRLAGEGDASASASAMGCLAGIGAGSRRGREEMVRRGAVGAAARVLRGAAAGAAERAMKVLEAAAGCAEGRGEICEGEAVELVVGRMMKAGKEGSEAAVGVLWEVCHRHRDRRAVDAASHSAGGLLTKLLLFLQSSCSAAAKQKATDLLKIFRVNAKSCLAGYETKTTHIMPF